MNSELNRAHLWVQVRNFNDNGDHLHHHHKHHKNSTADRKNGWLTVYQVTRFESGISLLTYRQQPITLPIKSKKSTWVKLDVKPLVSKWFDKPEENLGLVFHAYDELGKELVMGHPKSEDESQGN